MKKLFVLSLLTMSVAAQAQTGQTFPYMEVESLKNVEFKLPEDTKGKYTLIGLAYSKKSEDALKTWFSPTYNQFIKPPSKTDIFSTATNYDINLYFIPMFSGHKTVAYKGVMNKMNETVDEFLHPHVLFYKGTIKEYKKKLKFKGRDVPYFFLLDDKGKIVFATSGVYTTQKMQIIVDKLEEALG